MSVCGYIIWGYKMEPTDFIPKSKPNKKRVAEYAKIFEEALAEARKKA